jgi:exodeoxyribonuclease-3
MKCVSWNVNSIRARLPRVLEFLQTHSPDLLLVQETKCSAQQFPHAELAEVGYRSVDNSGGRWCGVALIVPDGIEVAEVCVGLDGQPNPEEARWVEGTIGDTTFVSVYVPNGREVASEHYEAKIEFLSRAAERATVLAERGQLLIAGDMNIAPSDADVWDINSFAGFTHVTQAERDALADLSSRAGLRDAWDLTDDRGDVRFTWWDYRGGGFHRNHGMRIDHFLLSEQLAAGVISLRVERDFRKGEKPSDHAPVTVVLDS